MNRKLLLFLAAAICFLIAGWQAFDFLKHPPLSFMIDFKSYWTAFQLFARHANPYDHALLAEAESALIARELLPIIVWYPPWFFVFLGPVLMWSYPVSLMIWLLLQPVLAFLICRMAWSFYGVERPSFKQIAFGLIFLPSIANLFWGQAGMVLALGLIGFFWAIQRQKEFLCGFFFALTLIKPHIFYLLYPVLGFWILRERKIRILVSILGWSDLAVIILLFRFPNAIIDWIHSFQAAPPFYWQTSTLVSMIRLVIAQFTGAVPYWPVFIIPAIALIITIYYYGLVHRTIDWRRDLPLLLCASVFTSPYGWLYDQSVLTLVYISCLLMAEKDKRVFVATLGLQVLLFLTMLLPFRSLIVYFWFPFALGAVWWWASRRVSRATT